MGVVVNITQRYSFASINKRITVTAKDITQVGTIDIRYYTAPPNGFKKLEYKK